MTGKTKPRSAAGRSAAVRSAAVRSAAVRSTLAADIVLIDQHMSRYTYMVDSRRYEDWAKLFTPDAVFDQAWQDENGDLHPVNNGAGLHLVGRKEIAAFIRRRFGPAAKHNLPRPVAGIGHRLVNRLIDVDGDTASLHARGPNGNFQYQVSLRRSASGPDGGWKFTRVFIIFDADRKTP